ncbi:MAG: hypothetical protein WC764_01940 [Candidatus Paceibacterota bacterium]
MSTRAKIIFIVCALVLLVLGTIGIFAMVLLKQSAPANTVPASNTMTYQPGSPASAAQLEQTIAKYRNNMDAMFNSRNRK